METEFGSALIKERDELGELKRKKEEGEMKKGRGRRIEKLAFQVVGPR